MLRVDEFDSFEVSRELIPPDDPTVFDEERYEPVYVAGGVAVADALVHHRAGEGYRTWMMFPFEAFMKGLCKEVSAGIPESISGGYVPWDTGIHNGRWSLVSYDEGTITQSSQASLST